MIALDLARKRLSAAPDRIDNVQPSTLRVFRLRILWEAQGADHSCTEPSVEGFIPSFFHHSAPHSMDTGNPISKAVFSSFQRVFRQFKSTSPATSFDETRQYVHKPLRTPDAIRVLELLPGERHKNLSCRIIETRQSIPDIEFEALSYVWGKPIFSSRLHEVESDTVLHITHNLYLALRALRYPDRSRYLWADAICINQSENAEKSHQVKNMGSIYAMASMVVVWLGDGDSTLR